MPNWTSCRRAFAWVNRLPPRFVVAVATLGPVGRIKFAPGTFGSAAGVLYASFLPAVLPMPTVLAVWLLMLYVAVAFCDAAEIHLGRSDPGCIILDEFVAMPFCFIFIGPGLNGWLHIVAAFVLFRLYDVWKPFGIRRLQKLPGGLGVVVDDLAAAFATSVTVSLLGYLLAQPIHLA